MSKYQVPKCSKILVFGNTRPFWNLHVWWNNWCRHFLYEITSSTMRENERSWIRSHHRKENNFKDVLPCHAMKNFSSLFKNPWHGIDQTEALCTLAFCMIYQWKCRPLFPPHPKVFSTSQLGNRLKNIFPS